MVRHAATGPACARSCGARQGDRSTGRVDGIRGAAVGEAARVPQEQAASGGALEAERPGMASRSHSADVQPQMADAVVGEGMSPAEPGFEARCLFDRLPAEMLSAVLVQLDWKTLLLAAPAVCRTWRAVCRDLVPAVFEFPRTVNLDDGVLRAIGARFKKTRGVAFGQSRNHHRVTNGGVEGLVMQCGQLRRLELTLCRLDVARLMPAVTALPHLQVLG